MAPPLQFRVGLDLFIGGAPRWRCNPTFSRQVSIFRMFPCAETTIEEKHGQVTLDLKTHHIGPTRVSLANRLPMMERMLSTFPDQLPHLVECLEKTRAIAEVPQLWEFTAHPMLKHVNTHRGPSSWVPLVKSIIYHCDLDTGYRSLRPSILLDSKVRKRRSFHIFSPFCQRTDP